MLSIYKPSYVDYWRNSHTNMSIGDYTRLYGLRLMPSNMIYAPLTVSVCLNPDVTYNLQIETDRKNWCSELCSGVREMMNLPTSISVQLHDDRGRNISTLSMHELKEIGALYPHVEKKGRVSSKRYKIGDEVKVPALLSVNKRALFKDWMDGVSRRIVDGVSEALGKCEDISQVGDRLTLKSKKSIKSNILSALKTGFKESVDLHTTNPEVKEEELADNTANLIMAAIKEGFKGNKERVRDYYRTKKQGSVDNNPGDEEDRNIFEAEIGNSILLRREYPHQQQLFADIVESALRKEDIGRHVYYLVVRGGRSRMMRHRRRHKKKNKKHHHSHRYKTRSHHKKHHGRSFEMFTSDRGAYFRTLRKDHAMKRLPSFPGTTERRHSMRRMTPGLEEEIGAPGLYSAEEASSLQSLSPMERVPSLESVGGGVPSIEPIACFMKHSKPKGFETDVPSIEPILSKSGGLENEVPSIEPILSKSNVPGLESAYRLEDEVPSIEPFSKEEIPEIESIWSDDDEDDLDSVPALETVGSEMFSSSDELYLSDDDDEKAPVKAVIGERRKKIVIEAEPKVVNSGLPSLSSMKRELGLVSSSTTTESVSNLKGAYSKATDDANYGNAMKVMSHYIGRHVKYRRRHHNHHHRHRRRRRVHRF